MGLNEWPVAVPTGEVSRTVLNWVYQDLETQANDLQDQIIVTNTGVRLCVITIFKDL